MSNPLLFRRLFRSLLKVSKPFRVGGRGENHSACVMNCLLHRTGVDDDSWSGFLRNLPTKVSSEDNRAASSVADDSGEIVSVRSEFFTPSKKSHDRESQRATREEDLWLLFRTLLREVVSGSSTGILQMQFPSHVDDTDRLRKIIRREFKDTTSRYDLATRRDVAFMALRELNKKLSLVASLSERRQHPQQAARNVKALPMEPSAYLRPGAYLLAHPNMTGYFRRSVICILDHVNEDGSRQEYGTYGLIVNRYCKTSNDESLSLEEVLHPLPSELSDTFGSSVVKEGGPVHMAIQMLFAATSDSIEETKIGGSVLLEIPASDEKSTAFETDKAVYYRGGIIRASEAVRSGKLDRDDVTFFVGASSWSQHQLEEEVARGFWLPCSGPTSIAQTGICEHEYEPTENYGSRPEADLWLSMMSACGTEEAKLAHLVFRDSDQDENASACDIPE